MITKITKIIASHFAIVNEIPEINPNPNIADTIATIKNNSAQTNQLDNAFWFICFPPNKIVLFYELLNL